MIDFVSNSLDDTERRGFGTLQYGNPLFDGLFVFAFAGSTVNSSAVGVVVGFGILIILFSIAILQFCCKNKCKKWMKCKNRFKKKGKCTVCLL